MTLAGLLAIAAMCQVPGSVNINFKDMIKEQKSCQNYMIKCVQNDSSVGFIDTKVARCVLLYNE